MAFQFEVSKSIMKGSAGSRYVLEAVVRRRSLSEDETFRMDPLQPTTSPVARPPGAPNQFFRLEPLVSQREGNYQVAKLIFQADAEAFHTPFYDPCLRLGQLMQVDGGVGPMELPIQLCCALHPLQQVLNAFHAAADAAGAVVGSVFAHLKSLIAPGKTHRAQIEPKAGLGNVGAERDTFREAS